MSKFYNILRTASEIRWSAVALLQAIRLQHLYSFLKHFPHCAGRQGPSRYGLPLQLEVSFSKFCKTESL